MVDDAPVFVVGADRSGTTLLRLFLNEHSSLAIPPESEFLIDLLDVFEDVPKLEPADVARAITIVASHPRFGDWRSTVFDLAAEFHGSGAITLAEFIDRIYRVETSGKPKWGDKTPHYVTHIRRLASVFPNAKFVNIHRDGRDVFLSLRRLGWHGRTPWRISRHWVEAVAAAEAARRALGDDRVMHVSYEELVRRPEGRLPQVCGFLDLPFERPMLDFHLRAGGNLAEWELERGFHTNLLRSPSHLDAARWPNQGGLPVRLFEASARAELKSLGYPVRVSPPEAVLLRALARAQQAARAAKHHTLRPLRRALRLPAV